MKIGSVQNCFKRFSHFESLPTEAKLWRCYWPSSSYQIFIPYDSSFSLVMEKSFRIFDTIFSGFTVWKLWRWHRFFFLMSLASFIFRKSLDRHDKSSSDLYFSYVSLFFEVTHHQRFLQSSVEFDSLLQPIFLGSTTTGLSFLVFNFSP